jgi:hypothetical protein
MLSKYKEFKFKYCYSMAGWIHELFYDDPEEEYLRDHFDITDALFRNKISKPDKYSLLHIIIEYYWNYRNEYLHRKLGFDDIIDDFENILKTYSIPLPKKPKYNKKKSDYNDSLYEYCDDLLSLVGKTTKRIVDEVFNILFNDRMFLLKFNLIISDIIKEMELIKYPDILDNDGQLKRCSNIPTWLQKAIIYRDKGICQICGIDISGVWTTEDERQFDHVVPLKLGGSNDPTNFQLLCKTCNSKKSGTKIETSEKYLSYW